MAGGMPFGMVSASIGRRPCHPGCGDSVFHAAAAAAARACCSAFRQPCSGGHARPLPPLPSPMQQPQIILLKEGTDTSQGKPQLISNINACYAVADVVRTTLGPRGMDKLMHTERAVTVSNDGATIMKTLDIVHPAAKTLVDISLAQDAEVGAGRLPPPPPAVGVAVGGWRAGGRPLEWGRGLLGSGSYGQEHGSPVQLFSACK